MAISFIKSVRANILPGGSALHGSTMASDTLYPEAIEATQANVQPESIDAGIANAVGNNWNDIQKLWLDRLWTNNPGLVQLLGLCPLLAVSNTLQNAFALGIATLVTLLISNTIISLLKPWLRRETRIIVYVLVIASAVTLIDLTMQAYWPDLHRVLGLFIPLIVTNCAIIARAEVFASRQAVWPSVLDALACGTGFLLVLCLLGFVRETLAASGLLLAILPPGAFITMGLLIAAKNWLDDQHVSIK